MLAQTTGKDWENVLEVFRAVCSIRGEPGRESALRLDADRPVAYDPAWSEEGFFFDIYLHPEQC